MTDNKKLAYLEILIADLIWGFGFIATTWALVDFTQYQILNFRFLLVIVIVLPFIIYKLSKENFLFYLKMSFVPALFLILEVFFQISGLQYTTPSKAGFITVLFIVLVPVLDTIIYKVKIPRKHIFWVALSLLGTVLIVNGPISLFNSGDALMLASAICASLHILIISRINHASYNLFYLNLFQCLWGSILTLPLLLINPLKDLNAISIQSYSSLFFIAFGTTLLAFYLQIRAQKNISASVASLLFLLESVFAALFSFYLLNEHLSVWQLIGCAIVLGTSMVVILSSSDEKRV